MTDRIDHAAEAQKWIDYSADLNPEVDFARIQHAAVLGAQHAALAGVEQQRVANLIALASVEGLDVSKPWSAGFYESLRLDIVRYLLGLGGESNE